jgi:hypothetical protein
LASYGGRRAVRKTGFQRRNAGLRYGILETALAQEIFVRDDFVGRACGPDNELRAEVEVLLRGLDESSSFMQEPVFTLSGSANDPLTGASVASWKLLRRIGDGGTASV